MSVFARALLAALFIMVSLIAGMAPEGYCSEASEVYISSTKTATKISVVVPDFVREGGFQDKEGRDTKMADILADDLNFSGYFDAKRVKEVKGDPSAWASLQVADVVQGSYSTDGRDIEIQGKVIDAARSTGAEAIHLEEPEFWVQDGYEEGFKREWRSYFHEDWQPPHSSVDAQWRASKLKYFLYRRALQQVFDYVQDYNHRSGRHVRCYVPTHSLLNYAHWRIVSPESSLARLNGCDGYIAQVWTGTSRTPNLYRGQLRERTFETAFLEYGAMQNLVRATGRTMRPERPISAVKRAPDVND